MNIKDKEMTKEFYEKAQTLLNAEHCKTYFNHNSDKWLDDNGCSVSDLWKEKYAQLQEELKQATNIANDEDFVKELKERLRQNYTELVQVAKKAEPSNLMIKSNESVENIMPVLVGAYLNNNLIDLLEYQDFLLSVASVPKSLDLSTDKNYPLYDYGYGEFYESEIINLLTDEVKNVYIGIGKRNFAEFRAVLQIEKKEKLEKKDELVNDERT